MPLSTLTTHRRALHKIPELMYDLPKTQAYILDVLKPLDCKIEIVAQTGVLAYFDADKPETVAFRTDMDALPVTEATNCEYISAHPGMMHACGHDGHMAMLLTFAQWVNANIASLPRNVLLIFQPSEESGAGGAQVVASNCLERYGVTRAFAIHVDPERSIGAIASRPGPLMAQASELFLNIHGKAGHAAVPGAGLDALAAAVDFVHAAYAADATLPKDKPRRIKFCKLVSGNSTNVVADRAEVMGTLRTFSDADFDIMTNAMRESVAQVEAEYGVKCEFTINAGYPATLNDEALLAEVEAITPIERIPEPQFIGEDFSYYGRRVPAVMFRLGLGTGIPLHAATFDFDESALIYGYELYKTLAKA
jgi:hippurate hydrolase